jgi:hypothetical protein
MTWLEVIPTAVTVVGGLILARMLRPNELIDQLQEERTEIRARVLGLETRERVRDDYILTLRQHINDEKPPPPPPWPAALTTRDT